MHIESQDVTPAAEQEEILSDRQKEDFRTIGYTLVPGVLSAEEVSRARSFLTRKFDSGERQPGDESNTLVDVFTRFEELRFLLANEKLVGSLRSLLGDGFVLYPISSAHDSIFGIWHKDTTAPERDGWRFHREPNFKMAQVALYLQDNNEYGGGLTLVPGSQHKRDSSAKRKGDLRSFRNRVARQIDEIRLNRQGVDIPSRAGDLVMFDFRCDHRASRPKCKPEDIPPDERKLALFFPASTNNEHAREYLRFIMSRDYYPHLHGGHEYPPEVRDLAQRQGMTLL